MHGDPQIGPVVLILKKFIWSVLYYKLIKKGKDIFYGNTFCDME